MLYYILSHPEKNVKSCGILLIFRWILSYCNIWFHEQTMNIVKNKTNCIPGRYNCKCPPVNRRQTVENRTCSVSLSPASRILAKNPVCYIVMIARNLQFIWRIVLKSEPHALIVIKSAENEVNRLTNPCKTCILYIVFTYKSKRRGGFRFAAAWICLW